VDEAASEGEGELSQAVLLLLKLRLLVVLETVPVL
jgi:hypothetical protein